MSKKSSYKVAMVGATGAVGETLLAILAERDFPISELVPLASERSAGERITFGGKSIVVKNLADYDFDGVDIAFFSAGGSVSRVHAPRAAAAGAVVIDNTSEFRYQDDIPLVVSEVNPHAIADYTVRGIIANPNCSTMQMLVALPQRKVRFYEAVTRLRDEKDEILTPDDFIGTAEAAGLMGRIDHAVMLRCVQVLRRLMVRNKEVGIFCNVAAATLSNPATFAQCLDFLEANRALAASFVLEFKQSTFRNLGATETEHLAALAQRGYRFSIDHVTDLRIEPRELADRGVRFIKVPAALLLDQRQASA